MSHQMKLRMKKERRKKIQSRKREVNPYGMYLKELKENCSQKLDLKSAFLTWSKMTDSQKEKYKEKSLQDRKVLKVKKQQSKDKIKNRTAGSFIKQVIRKKLKPTPVIKKI